MDFFYCKFIFIFQPERCAVSTCAAMCINHFVISHHSDNIRLILPSYVYGVFICSFIYSFLVAWVGSEISVYNSLNSVLSFYSDCSPP